MLVVGWGGVSLWVAIGSQLLEADTVTQIVEHSFRLELIWGAGNEVGISVVATLDQLQIVPAAEAEDARAVHVPGVGAPEESGTQHCA